ncbi:hypothetical protein GQ457_01G008700 [Hibiscus cannabinus]
MEQDDGWKLHIKEKQPHCPCGEKIPLLFISETLMDKQMVEVKALARQYQRVILETEKNKSTMKKTTTTKKKKKKKKKRKKKRRRGRMKRRVFALWYKKLKLATLYFIHHYLLSNTTPHNLSYVKLGAS